MQHAAECTEAGVVDFVAGPPRPPAPELSDVWFWSTNKAQRVRLPTFAVVKRSETSVDGERPTFCECHLGEMCARGWPQVRWSDVIVAAALDENGERVFGWFVYFEREPETLVRVPPSVVEEIYDAEARAKRATLGINEEEYWDRAADMDDANEEWNEVRPAASRMLDTSFHSPFDDRLPIDFLSLAECRYAGLGDPHDDAPVARRTRAAAAAAAAAAAVALAPPPLAPSKWGELALPRRPLTAHIGECRVCFSEGAVLQPGCCGTAAAVCARCYAETRGACLVCQRDSFGATYTCASCGRDGVPFHDYGYGCAACEARALCAGCSEMHAMCDLCDPLRM